jgi:hypothetical protein
MKDYFQKENVPKKEFIEELGFFFFCGQKQFTNLVFGKYLTKTFGSTFLSKIKFPFHETIFTRSITKVSGEKKLIICSSYIGW